LNVEVMARQQLLSSMFSSISKVEREVTVEHELETLASQMELERASKKEIEKRPVGRPKKELSTFLTTSMETAQRSKPTKKVRGPYTNWFIPSLWDPIFAIVTKHRNLKGALRFLQLKYRLPGQVHGIYDKLTRSSLAEWFTNVGELKDRTKQAIFKEIAAFTGGPQHAYILSGHIELEEDIITLLKSHQDAGQALFASTVRGLIRTLIQKRVPYLLDNESQSGFKVSIPWTRDFVRTNLGWSFRKATGAARKLPKNWEDQGLQMVQRAAYLVKAHNILATMMVNSDQTGIHIVPLGGARTWAKKGSKHVLVHGIEDKRQITCTVSSTIAGELLPFQLIFTGSTDR
jgi:hypothetical protein